MDQWQPTIYLRYELGVVDRVAENRGARERRSYEVSNLVQRVKKKLQQNA